MFSSSHIGQHKAPSLRALLELQVLNFCSPIPQQVIQADGSMLSCAFNAACTALVDAGIPMTQMLGEFER